MLQNYKEVGQLVHNRAKRIIQFIYKFIVYGLNNIWLCHRFAY